MKKQFEVHARLHGIDNWQSAWLDDEGAEVVRFDSEADARAAIKEHIEDCLDAVAEGRMSDAPSPLDFKIVEVN